MDPQTDTPHPPHPDDAPAARPETAPAAAPAPEDAPTITLQSALQLAGMADTGGRAKLLIQAGRVRVNGAVETRRKRRLREGDEVALDDEAFVLELQPDG